MGSAVALRSDYTAIDLRRLAKGYDDNRQIRRLLALAAVYDGMNRTEAARVGGMDRQTLRDRVHRFNEYGPDGLINAQGAGRPRSLNDKQMRDLAQIVETGPDLESDGVVRWRRIDLVRVVRERFGVECSERSMSDYLAELGFSNISGRPQHPRQDGRVIEAFKKTSPRRSQPTWPICLKAHLLKYGSRMRRVSARRTVRCASGHAREPAHACQPTSAMKIRTCSAPSALDDYSRYIIAWKLCTTMRADDVTATLKLALEASGCDSARVIHKPRLPSDNGSSYISGDLADWLEDQGMDHVRGAPYHPQTQGKIERRRQTLKNRILLENHDLPGDLESRIGAFVDHYDNRRYHESIGNPTPADVYFGRDKAIIERRKKIKKLTIENRRLLHQQQAA